MSRELKFRAWYKDNYIELISLRGNRSIYFSPYDLGFITQSIDRKEVVLEQYTGLKDINGKEIYEGDIVKRLKSHEFLEDVAEIEVFRIRWGVKKAGFFAYSKARQKHNQTAKRLTAYDIYEVIGNIHENAELCYKRQK